MKTIKQADTFINIGSKGHFYLSTKEEIRQEYEYGYINTNLSVFANSEAEYRGLMIMPTSDFFAHKNTRRTKSGFEVNFELESYRLQIKEKVECIEGLNVFRQTTRVKNMEARSVRLSRLSCANITGIGIDGKKWFEDDNRFIVYYCTNRWQGEGQWKKATLKELGLYPASRHIWEKTTFRLQSVGSWSTSNYYPLLIIEDTEQGECWFFEREGAESWYIEINAFEGYGSPFINVAIGGADEAIGWHYDLKPNETYETGKAVYGVIKGTFEDAVRELLIYKRKYWMANHSIEITFNDFMNCNWAMPKEETLLRLIDRASKLGVECFCIDDGWTEQGKWLPLENVFPKLGLKGIIEYIHTKGMRAGVWFEFQRAPIELVNGKAKKYLLHRDGRVIAEHRPKWNMRSKKVRAWLMERIDAMYSLGVRYIKNDHNNAEGIGSNVSGQNVAEGVRRNERAFLRFIDEVRKKYPDLIFENCASGAMREDYGTLRHFDLQSTSDQEDYRLYPSILIGQLACLPPEKAGIWGYPYPLLYKDINADSLPQEERERHKDGRETVFNMVNAMMGYMYLSGRIDEADEYNQKLIAEGIEIYKSYRATLKERYPVFVLPLKSIYDNSFNAVGLKGEEDILLAVWGLEEKNVSLSLEKYGVVSVEKLYPVMQENCTYNFDGKVLDCQFEKEYSAVLFRCRIA